jgi:hypothetical protein
MKKKKKGAFEKEIDKDMKKVGKESKGFLGRIWNI